MTRNEDVERDPEASRWDRGVYRNFLNPRRPSDIFAAERAHPAEDGAQPGAAAAREPV